MYRYFRSRSPPGPASGRMFSPRLFPSPGLAPLGLPDGCVPGNLLSLLAGPPLSNEAFSFGVFVSLVDPVPLAGDCGVVACGKSIEIEFSSFALGTVAQKNLAQ
jgi:hypothetical protein